MTKSPSSKVGINSPPIVVKSPPPKTNNPKAPYSTFFYFAIPSYNGRYHDFNFLINLLENELGFSSLGFKTTKKQGT
jgi:hypothetical protein